ncbi:recombinase family protein [Vibrio furnissii]|uniref:recombinase family protein n=1 Tax=Vibrio furnissii TaxID=29494 RepID=UPI001EE9E1FA|nr:recombinase family protein [Vibrio furnissii]MCG6268441.1 recombinase family protein [Vibrio furnissii]
MFIFAYLRASTKDQNAYRAKDRLSTYAKEKGVRIAAWYIENESGASLKRPKLMQLLDDAQKGDVLLIEQVDRLSRLNNDDWNTLKRLLNDKQLKVVSLDLPTSEMALKPDDQFTDSFTNAIISALNGMMLDMLAAGARKEYQDRRRRQNEGIALAKQKGKYKGRQPDTAKHELIVKLRIENNVSIAETAALVGVSERTVIRVCNANKERTI